MKSAFLLPALAAVSAALALNAYSAGTAPAAADFPKAGLELWLSAGQVEQTDGAITVIKDLSGSDNPAKRDAPASTPAANPAVTTDAASGQPLLHFTGANVAFGFNRLTNILTAFWVVSKDPASFGQKSEKFVLGDKSGNDFHAGWTDDTIFNTDVNPGHLSKFLKDGKTWLNGKAMDATKTPFPKQLCVISIVSAGPVCASQLARDRNMSGRSWQGDIAEILLYKTALSDADRQAVEKYLTDKYKIARPPPAPPTSLHLVPSTSSHPASGAATLPAARPIPVSVQFMSGGSEALPGNGLSQHPFLYAGEWDTRKALQSMFIVRGGKVVWHYSIPLHNGAGGIQEFDDATLLANGNIIYSCMSGVGEISSDKDILWQYQAPPGTEMHSIQSIGKDRVLVMRNGNPAVAMIFNTASNKLEKTIPIPTTVTNTHGQFRHIRMTPTGTILVGHMGEGKVVEYDQTGKEVWSCKAEHVWEAIRLKNGNTLFSGDASQYVREVNPKGETVWELTKADVSFKLGNIQCANRLANGNTVICNWIAGDNDTSKWPGTVQVFEVNPAKKVVWELSSWKDPDLGPATSIQLLDEPGAPEDQQR
jgi:hypothetical protein